MILEYKLNKEVDGSITTPPWVESGGFLPNPADFTLIGFSPDVHEYYIPDTVVEYTVEELKQRSQTINLTAPYLNDDGTPMTEQEIDNMVQAIVDANS